MSFLPYVSIGITQLSRSSWMALMVALVSLSGGAALATPDAKPGASAAGPIQDFDWLLDKSLLKDEHHSDDEDDDDDLEAGDVTIERSRTTTTVTQISYTDLAADYWATDFIYRLSAIEVVKGFPGGAFRPAARLTKAQYAAMVAQAFDLPMVRPVAVVPGVSQDYWAYRAIQVSYAMGFLALDGPFNPDARLTRLDMLVFLARGLNITTVASNRSVDEILSVFTDADTIPVEYREIIAALVDRGILVSYPELTRLNLFAAVTRDEACGFVYQSLVHLNKVEVIESAYIVNERDLTIWRSIEREATVERSVEVERSVTVEDDDDDDDGDDDDDNRRQNCNQGIGNGAEGCDPGNSQPRGGSNDEGGRTPGNRP